MNNSETHSKGGFLRRIFGRNTPVGDNSSLNESGEIIMPTSSSEENPAKRLPKSKTVLVVAADDAATRRWRRELENGGYGIETVADGIQGLDILYNFSFDALLIDWAAPKIVGADMLREIRNHAELKSLFVGVFARDKDGKAEQEMAALDAGASRVFQRSSVKADEILTALKTALFPPYAPGAAACQAAGTCARADGDAHGIHASPGHRFWSGHAREQHRPAHRPHPAEYFLHVSPSRRHADEQEAAHHRRG